MGIPASYGPYFDFSDAWLPYIKERIHQLLIPAVQFSTYEQIRVYYDETLVTQTYAEYTNKTYAPSHIEMEDEFIATVRDKCEKRVPKTNLSLVTRDSTVAGNTNTYIVTGILEMALFNSTQSKTTQSRN
jgi:hypothetical protein